MAWELCLHEAAANQLKSLPADLRPQFEAGFAKLASDPKKYGHTPVMPYAWKGPLWDFRVHHADGRWHNVTVFFLFDDDPAVEKIYIHEMHIMTPNYGENPAPVPPALRGEVIEIGPPHRPKKGPSKGSSGH